ncbi:LysM peptidoglycan-binding domain-containing protein [Paenibacillus albiflavus]|uniref:LysM peptidoglycan-binding domain-containing protein n=1 Tax=Paenibacillus albiflavus TaxID=2545760 RepID=A0A4R4EMI5_9BACL|nr:LysM peptidoglycan-binding domain-containing protein [Paenibacillus albiflavus]TCZ81047.1 LysM peptidoglycan-binding domain-containing protein [Paenibacillus albiflavus]
MYLSNHANLTAGPLHRSVNRTNHAQPLKARQANTQTGKTKPIKAVRLIILITILTLVFLSGAIVHAYAALDPVSVKGAQSTDTSNMQADDVQPTYVVVYSGDTLWSIATEHASAQIDKRTYIKKIMALNHLTSTVVMEGQRLQLP